MTSNTVRYILGCALLILLGATKAHAIPAEYQLCPINSSCKIGEFLYDDSYAPITDASCTLTSRDPSGNPYLSVAATHQSDGWYEYTVNTSGATQGIYRTQFCCTTTDSQYLCLDKTFQIDDLPSTLTASDVEGAVLDASLADHTTSGTIGERLNSISSLAGDVWGYSTRSLSTFGTLIAQIWQYEPTDAETTVTNVYTTITQQFQEQRTLLEQLANEPIVRHFLEEGQAPNLQAKIDKTRDTANNIYATTQTTKSRLTILSKNWLYLSEGEVTEELSRITKSVGLTIDAPLEGSILADAVWLETAWGNPVTTEIANHSQTAITNLLELQNNVEYYGKNNTASAQVRTILGNIESLESVIGDVSNPASAPTLFGLVRKVQTRAEVLDTTNKNLDDLLANMGAYSQNELENKINDAEDDVLGVNEFKGATSILQNVTTDLKKRLKNTLLSLQAIVDINRSLLAYNTKQPVYNIWLEEGSIVFRSVITNPSKIISQTVPLKYYLPREVIEERIIDLDPALITGYDAQQDSLYVEGGFELGPDESRLVFVEVEDIWFFTEEELTTYKTKAAELFKALEKSPLASQAASLKSDIDVQIEKIRANQDLAKTPSSRIKTHRENMLELLTVQENIATMEQLVASTDASGSILGFIGGSQAILAWGLIGIFLTGFVFLTLYMKRLNAELHPKKKKAPVKKSLERGARKTSRFAINKIAPLTVIAIATSTIAVVLLTSFLKNRSQPPQIAPIEPVQTPPLREATEVEDNTTILGKDTTSQMLLRVPDEGTVNIRTGPGTDYEVVLSVKTDETAYIFETKPDDAGDLWARIGFTDQDTDKAWWISYEFLEDL